MAQHPDELPQPPPITLTEKLDLLDIGMDLRAVLENDTTFDGLVGKAIMAGVSVQAIEDMRQHDDPARLLARAIIKMDSYCDPTRVYSQGVNFHLDGNRDATRNDFINYVRGPGPSAARAQRYKARALVRRNFADRAEFDEFMDKTGERAQGIRRGRSQRLRERTNPDARQEARNLAAATEPISNSNLLLRGKPEKLAMQASKSGIYLHSRFSPAQLQQLRLEHVTGHGGIIGALDTEYLSRSIIDTTPFPDLIEPESAEAMAMLTISPNNTVAIGDKSAELAGQRLVLFNVLLLLKGQSVTVPDIARSGVPKDRIREGMLALRARFNEGTDTSRHIFQKDVIWLDGAYRLNGDLGIMDMRPQSRSRPIFTYR